MERALATGPRDHRRAARRRGLRRVAVHELSWQRAVIDTAERHAGGRSVTAVHLRVGELRQVVPDSLAFYFEHVARGTLCEGAVLEQELIAGAAALRELRARSGRPTAPAFRCPDCGGGRRRRSCAATSSRWSRSRSSKGGRMHRVKVRVVEDALDANNTIARANRADFDAHGVTVINLMSAPGAGKTTLLEAPAGRAGRRHARRRARGRRAGLDGRRPAAPACTCR